MLANVWMHCGPLMVDSDKMSKSLGNFRSIRETVSGGAGLPGDWAAYPVNLREAEMLRFFIVRNHYRSVQNYTPDNLLDAQNALDRLYQTLHNAGAASREPDEANQRQPGEPYRRVTGQCAVQPMLGDPMARRGRVHGIHQDVGVDEIHRPARTLLIASASANSPAIWLALVTSTSMPRSNVGVEKA